MSKVAALGYIVVRGPLEPWRTFGTEVLGAQVVPGHSENSIAFRTDDRAYRIVVEDGPPGPDSLIALGFETGSEHDLRALVADVTARGIDVTEEPGLARIRRVRELVSFIDIDGNRIEAYYGLESKKEHFASPRGVRFITGDLGLGHVFMVSADGARSAQFYEDTLGFKVSDTIAFGEENGIFMRCNPRHHTIAFAAIPGPPPGLNHLLIEVDSLETVGRALDVVQAAGHPILMSLGEHSNDHMTSFYVMTPSGFAIEYGWNGLLVDDETWHVGHYDAPSVWGHHFNAPPIPEPADIDAATAGAQQ